MLLRRWRCREIEEETPEKMARQRQKGHEGIQDDRERGRISKCEWHNLITI